MFAVYNISFESYIRCACVDFFLGEGKDRNRSKFGRRGDWGWGVEGRVCFVGESGCGNSTLFFSWGV